MLRLRRRGAARRARARGAALYCAPAREAVSTPVLQRHRAAAAKAKGATAALVVVARVRKAALLAVVSVVLVGVPSPDMRLDLPLLDFFGRGGALKSSWYGDCLPSRDFPMLIDLFLQGRLPLDRFVSEEIGLDGVEAAFEKMHHGGVLRSVVVL